MKKITKRTIFCTGIQPALIALVTCVTFNAMADSAATFLATSGVFITALLINFFFMTSVVEEGTRQVAHAFVTGAYGHRMLVSQSDYARVALAIWDTPSVHVSQFLNVVTVLAKSVAFVAIAVPVSMFWIFMVAADAFQAPPATWLALLSETKPTAQAFALLYVALYGTIYIFIGKLPGYRNVMQEAIAERLELEGIQARSVQPVASA